MARVRFQFQRNVHSNVAAKSIATESLSRTFLRGDEQIGAAPLTRRSGAVKYSSGLL
jgi:hypothetical protein